MALTTADVLVGPPRPAKVTLDQAAKFARSLLRGEPNSQKIALAVLGDRIRELV
jgi:pyruvate dehydrogenase (quinone)